MQRRGSFSLSRCQHMQSIATRPFASNLGAICAPLSRRIAIPAGRFNNSAHLASKTICDVQFVQRNSAVIGGDQTESGAPGLHITNTRLLSHYALSRPRTAL